MRRATDDLSKLWTYFADTSRLLAPLRPHRPDGGGQPSCAGADRRGATDRPPTNHASRRSHYLLLEGLEHPLAPVYAGTSDADAGPLFIDLCLSQRDQLLQLLSTRRTNTNEVRRSAVLGPALTAVATQLGRPLGLVDVGCSAGLNLLCDRYLLDYGSAGRSGRHDAAVRISCEVVGGRPPIAPTLPRLGARIGIDRHPVDVEDDDQARWLLACMWPGTERLARTRRALEELRRTLPQIVQGDAVEFVRDVVLGLPGDVVPVVVTTWALAYLPIPQRVAFRETLAAAARERPIAWISGEGPGVIDLFAEVDTRSDAQGVEASVLGAVVFHKDDCDVRFLAFVHPHGSWIDWRA